MKGPGYEPRDIAIGPIVKVGMGLTAAVIIVHLVCYALQYVIWEPTSGQARKEIVQTLPPEPRLQIAPPVDMAQMRAQEEEQLNQAGWVDREHGIARIPIEEAMGRIVRQGLPARENQPKK